MESHGQLLKEIKLLTVSYFRDIKGKNVSEFFHKFLHLLGLLVVYEENFNVLKLLQECGGYTIFERACVLNAGYEIIFDTFL